jgi:CRP/FNR family transcriptional regulator
LSTFENLLFTRVDQRLASYLLNQCKGKTCILYITHEQIAAHLNTAREVVSRLMGELKRRGILDYERGKVKILNLEALKALMVS